MTVTYESLTIEELKKEGVPEEQWWKTNEYGQKMLRLTKEHIKIRPVAGENFVIASLWANKVDGDYYEFSERIALADLPNDLVSLADLKRFGIDTINLKPAGGS